MMWMARWNCHTCVNCELLGFVAKIAHKIYRGDTLGVNVYGQVLARLCIYPMRSRTAWTIKLSDILPIGISVPCTSIMGKAGCSFSYISFI